MPDGPVRGLACPSWVYKEVLEWRLIRIAFLLLLAVATAFGLVQTVGKPVWCGHVAVPVGVARGSAAPAVRNPVAAQAARSTKTDTWTRPPASPWTPALLFPVGYARAAFRYGAMSMPG